MTETKTFNSKYRIYYEDTDSVGVVYYANYLKFFERGRTDFLRSKNIIQSELVSKFGIIFVVRNCFIEYFSPAKLDDLVEISTTIVQIKNASIKIKQEMIMGNKALSGLEVEIVCVDSVSLKPKKIPDHIYNIFTI